jgi:hypothetical protein
LTSSVLSTKAKKYPVISFLNDAGETIETLEFEDNQAKLERRVRDWLARIQEIEERRSKPAIA